MSKFFLWESLSFRSLYTKSLFFKSLSLRCLFLGRAGQSSVNAMEVFEKKTDESIDERQKPLI